jgi:putative RecB family exonuclease
MPLYSHSRLETFEQCPLKYKFQYIDKIEKPGFESIEAFVGSRVHEALKKLYDDLLFGKTNTLDELLDYYKSRWQVEWGPEVTIVAPGRTQQDYFEYGALGIKTYYAENQPFQQSRTLATEERVLITLDKNGRHKVQGYVDRIARREDGTYEIHDYKTARSLPPQTEVDSSRQLALYEMGLRERWRDVERVDLIWHYVRHGVALRSRRSAAQLVELRETTVELIERIETEKDFEPRKSPLCDWCEYKPDCPLWRHVLMVETLPGDKFRADDGVRLCDDYVRIKFEIEALEHRLEELKEQVVAFAKRQGLRVIQGSRANLHVKTSKELDFPKSGDPSRGDMENLLHRAGKWNDVSILSLPRLASAIKAKAWPQELIRKLRDFAVLHEKVSVSVQRPRDGSEEAE